MAETPLDHLRNAYADPHAIAQARKAAGARLIGSFLNSVPVELILAAGLDPIRLRGMPADTPHRAGAYMEEHFDGEVRAIFEALLADRYALLDLLVVPRSSEVYLQLYYLIREIPRWEPQARLPETSLFDLLQTPGYTTARYNLGRMKALAEQLAAIGGRAIDDTALSAAIVDANRLRTALAEASVLWRGPSPRLSGSDALCVIGAASVLDPADAIAQINALVAEPPPELARNGPRLLIKGSPQHDIRFTALVESCGAEVVAHDHLGGDRTFETLVSEEGNPWEALVHHYQREIPGPRAYPQAREDARFIALAEAAAVDGVIIFHDEWDDTLGWEYPDQKRLLDARGLPVLFLKRQPYFDPPQDEQRRAVNGFIESITEGAA